tara:strand:+ start:24789 stop:25781 length:993 start_codon:yes stop_codon:yes gene_type:complete
MHNNQKIIIFEGANSAFEQLATRCAEYEYAPRFKFNTNLESYGVLNKIEQRNAILKYADPYTIELLKATNMSITFNNKFCTYWVENQKSNTENKLKYLEKIDSEYSKLGTTIIYCYQNEKNMIFEKNHQKYLDFLDISMCKSLAVNISLFNEEDNFKHITSFLEMHKKFRDYRDTFYEKFVDYGNIVGSEILFIIEGDHEHLTNNNVEKRMNTKSGSEFEFVCNTQYRHSNTYKVINEIFNRTKINKFETSCIPLKKTNFRKISKLDLDYIRLELNLLKPKKIITFSNKIANYISDLNEARLSKIKSFNLPIIYSNKLFDEISEYINDKT